MNKYIKQLVKEQFNIRDIDFGDDDIQMNNNVFHKEYNHPYLYKAIDGTLTKKEVKELNKIKTGVAKLKNKEDLIKIIDLYAEKYPTDSLNWIDVSEITDMSELFEYRGNAIDLDSCNEFNGDISNWDVSNVTDMDWMFNQSKFNGDISNWDVSRVVSMDHMFENSSFNGNISNWDVSNVKSMSWMFIGTQFNQDISKWDVSNVTDMENMFTYSEFNQNISNWNISNVKYRSEMFLGCPIKNSYKPRKKKK